MTPALHHLHWPEAYVAGIQAEGGSGSGILVTPEYVLTCAHVLASTEEESTKYHHANRIKEANEALGIREGLPVGEIIAADGGKRQGILHAVHPDQDMALLRLTVPFPLVAPPAWYKDADLKDEHTFITAIGIRRRRGGEYYKEEYPQDCLIAYDPDNRNIAHIQLEGAAGEGMSGGPVVVRRGNGVRIAGMSCMGGDTAANGKMMLAQALESFLKRAGVSHRPEGGRGVYLQEFGLRSRIMLGDMEYIAIQQSISEDENTLYYAANTPLTHQQAAPPGTRRFHRQEGETFTLKRVRREETDEILVELRQKHRFTFSVPSLPLIRQLRRHTSSEQILPAPALENMPLTTFDLWSRTPAMLPPKAKEWVQDAYNGSIRMAAYDRESRPVVTHTPHHDSRAYLRPCIRISLEGEGGA